MISEVYNMDCMKYMEDVPDKFFDLVIADPPYFSGPEKRGFYGCKINKLNIKRKDYPLINEWRIPTNEYFIELKRISKHQIIWGINYFNFKNVSAGRIIWDKVNDSSSFSDCEIAYCSLIDSVRIFRYMWNGMMQGKSISEGHIMQGNKKLNEQRIHTNQKPVILYKWLLDKYANPDNRIFDSHMGSQSSRIAAYQMGFDYWGCELDIKSFNDGNKRFKEQTAQLKLFV